MAYDSTVNFLQGHAGAAMLRANNQASRISGLGRPNLREPNFNHSVKKPNIEAPPKFSDIFDGGDSSPSVLQWLNGQSDQWITKYFPSINGGLRTIPDDWLVRIISGQSPLGHSATYFELAWHRARDRAQRTVDSETAQIASEFSARGFSLPTGAYVDAVGKAQRRATDAILEVNREEALKDADIKLELLKFAEQQALQYKVGIMGAMADFYGKWLVLPDKDIERARIKAQAMTSFYAALGNYYNVELSFEELGMRAKQLKADVDLGVDRTRVANLQSDASTNAALGQAVRGFADISAQAAGAAGSLTAEIVAG